MIGEGRKPKVSIPERADKNIIIEIYFRCGYKMGTNFHNEKYIEFAYRWIVIDDCN